MNPLHDFKNVATHGTFRGATAIDALSALLTRAVIVTTCMPQL